MTRWIVLAGLLVSASAHAEETLWLGLDYSLAQFAGTSLDFSKPAEIFPGMLQKWNDLVVREKLAQLETNTGLDLDVNLDAVEAVNANASDKQIVKKSPKEKLSASDIAKAVAAYKIDSKAAQGLVVIMESLDKFGDTSCMHVVLFEATSRKIKQSKRECAQPRGFGFRNFWFGSVKTVIDGLGELQ